MKCRSHDLERTKNCSNFALGTLGVAFYRGSVALWVIRAAKRKVSLKCLSMYQMILYMEARWLGTPGSTINIDFHER